MNCWSLGLPGGKLGSEEFQETSAPKELKPNPRLIVGNFVRMYSYHSQSPDCESIRKENCRLAVRQGKKVP